MPGATCRIRHDTLSCRIDLQPTAASRVYSIRLRYRLGKRPAVSVLQPELVLHPGARRLPHVYDDGTLCLHYPWEWKPHMILAHTTLPWTSEWLYYYEIWRMTGAWTGGGH
ncbi:hypothetical protein DFJ66_2764 [Saccharothrix variisporea]|uniref:Type II CBASS E2 protein domain-containing protein n=2 Tax=Saccharothrix variisporea TaxID=543527 RepID=A0A495X5C8_9PSEU|nr:hypothetical protein DFJ66_2764 [Saccharothrix variisporea]